MNDTDVQLQMLAKRLKQKFVTVGLVPASLLLTLLAGWIGSPVFLLTAGGLGLLWVIFTLLNWRCPRCLNLLSVVDDISVCERCGAPL